jgi:hypothetical protein
MKPLKRHRKATGYHLILVASTLAVNSIPYPI